MSLLLLFRPSRVGSAPAPATGGSIALTGVVSGDVAIRQDITERADKPWFIGEVKRLEFEILKSDQATPEDVTGYALQWAARRKAADVDPPLIQKAARTTL